MFCPVMDNAYGDLSMLMYWADTVYNFPTYAGTVSPVTLPSVRV